MRTVKKARLLRLHFGESDRYKEKPLYEAIVNRCKELKIAGATVFRGLEGYGATAEIHRHHNKFSSRITQPKSQGASQAMLYATGLTRGHEQAAGRHRQRLVSKATPATCTCSTSPKR
jgi:hypothetical protein